jgi:hypothetical protein
MMLAAIELERPWALVLLALPMALLLLVRLRARPEEDATGTLEIWRRAVQDAPTSAARNRRRIPPAVWALCAALICAAVAIAGPHSAAEAESVLVVVDRSPSMYLRDGDGTRLDHAVAMAHEWLAGHEPGSVRWIAPPSRPIPRDLPEFKFTRLSADSTVGVDLPGAWKQAPEGSWEEPDFEAYDRPGCLWISDRLPSVEPRDAGYSCSGGRAVPGPVGVHDGHFVDWDGTKLVETGRAVAKQTVFAGDELPEPISRAVQVWAKARGFEFSKQPDDTNAFRVLALGLPDARFHDVTVGRDGWSGRATGDGNALLWMTDPPGFTALVPLQPWLTDEIGSATWVSERPGMVSVAFTKLERIEGDPAAFAVSWGQLLDSAVLSPAECVPLAERTAAGDTRTLHFGSPAISKTVSRWPAWFAAAACALALVAAALSRPFRQGLPEHAPGSNPS